jgi:hypothetical protein
MRRPSLGLLEPPWPMPSGRIRKYRLASSRPPAWNSTLANSGRRNWAPLPVVPCRISTAFCAWPCGSRTSVPIVR